MDLVCAVRLALVSCGENDIVSTRPVSYVLLEQAHEHHFALNFRTNSNHFLHLSHAFQVLIILARSVCNRTYMASKAPPPSWLLLILALWPQGANIQTGPVPQTTQQRDSCHNERPHSVLE